MTTKRQIKHSAAIDAERFNNLKTKTKLTFTALLLFALLAPTAVWAQFGGGSGTETNPYIISTTDHLDQLAANVNSGMEYQNVYFKLMDDLDYTGKTYTPIGISYMEGGSESYHKFKGIFNGNNHSINNVTIYSEGLYCGLFGCVGWGGKIHNLTLGGQSTITAVGFAGGIAGWVDNAEIIGCNVGENVVITVHPIANNYSTKPGDFGGIVGESGGKVKDCISRATVSNGGIGKTECIGGIAGRLYNNPMENCRFLGVVDATGSTNYVGDILGKLRGSGQLVSNYYHTSNRHGGVDGNDTDNAKWMGTISCVSPVSGYGTSAVFDDGTTRYFGANRFTWVVLNYNVEEGYLPCGITYMANDTIPLTNPDGNYYPFTMPDDDVVITGTVEAIKRDIGYSDWVSITIPEQDYTGEPLTPVVTVVDNKDGAALTLEEGTHYTVTLPDGGCVIPGYHNITITGMGDFAGQTTKTFTILNPGSGTEEDPYIIRNTDQMDGLAASVNGGDSKSGKFFRLEADLDYSGKNYTTIGTTNRYFRGSFDGNGHTISHVTIDGGSGFNAIGIFGATADATVKNLTLDYSSIHSVGGFGIGGIVGFCAGGTTVTDCLVTENVSIIAEGINNPLGGKIGGSDIGGIVGHAYHCTVSNCMNFAEVSGVNYVGGVVGCNDNSTITNNYYAGNSTVGGIGDSGSNSGSDVEGQAQRGYAIEPQQPLGISLEGSIGVFYDGKVYAGENQEALVSFGIPNSIITPQCYTLSTGTLDDNGDGTCTITMPAEDITVNGNIVEHESLYFQLDCEGGTTATVIQHDSYATTLVGEIAVPYGFTYDETYYEVTAIGDHAFEGCTGITKLYLDENMAAVGIEAFKNCTGLTKITAIPLAPPTAAANAFSGVPTDIPVEVAFCSQYDYSVATGWSGFNNFQGTGPCEHTFMGMEDNLWSNPNNWMGGLPDANSTVGIYGNCEIDVDMTVKSVTIGDFYMEDGDEIIMDKLVVKSGKTLTATNFIYTTGDATHFIIEDGAQVYHPNAGAEATVEKNITAYTPNSKNGWHLVSSPAIESFAPSADNGFLANEYDLYFYEESTHHWRNHKPNGQYANFNIEPLKGYLYANSANDTLQLQGTLRTATETVSVPLSCTGGIALAGFNIVGNPFAHNVTAFTGSNVAMEVYRMNETKDDLTVANITATDPLKPGEGFFVKATGDEASITFNSRATNAERSNITLEVSEKGLIIDRFILKRDGAPLEKLTLNENSTKVYATEGAQDWAVTVIASEAKQSSLTEQPINFKAAKNGTYTLTVNVENMEFDYLHLIDNLSGADVDLLQTPQYAFTAKTTDYASRFRLVFSVGVAGEAARDPMHRLPTSATTTSSSTSRTYFR